MVHSDKLPLPEVLADLRRLEDRYRKEIEEKLKEQNSLKGELQALGGRQPQHDGAWSTRTLNRIRTRIATLQQQKPRTPRSEIGN